VPRTVAQLEKELLRLLPSQYQRLRDLLIAYPGVFREVELSTEEFVDAATIGGADGIWLTLLAQGYGVPRAPSEADASVRARLRNVERQVTRDAILEAVEAILVAYGTSGARMVEWFEQPFADNQEEEHAWADISYVSGGPNTFLIFVPLVETLSALDSFADLAWTDFADFAGEDGESPMYAAIISEVERIRAAGIRWALVVED